MLLNMSINSYVYHQFLIILISNTRMGSSRSLSKEWKIINRMPQTSKDNNKDIFHRSESFPFKIAGDCSRIYFSIRGSRAHLFRAMLPMPSLMTPLHYGSQSWISFCNIYFYQKPSRIAVRHRPHRM